MLIIRHLSRNIQYLHIYSVLAHLAGDVSHADLLQELAEPRPGVARHDGAHREAVRPELIISRYLVSTLSSVSSTIDYLPRYRLPVHLVRQNHVAEGVDGLVEGKGAAVLVADLSVGDL